ncbi:hypothetical protein CPU12_08795 [Malaciobacter molluscorum LMG 25693]|uniref:Membrane protein n=1 Tax=Malaciobacter molluscorum LMG 25693 TaxID=870501 RepID=A0A2G1DHC6_9BACT|nr:hypothetical protein [Malaciobacter molluscorum]AXX93444.1 putative membrane protein [Malaciobacter molluscorum LMG 25693]PHO17844.1 hypothetical protein CPU12_08795 [Malaciobacter molluscorum LMG 25693]RXJ95040.1 hypothetical protein CRV00_04595 [Malaciobacter molluscorum]
MREFLELYEENSEKIEYYLQESLKNIGRLSPHKNYNFIQLFNLFPSLELVYIVNKDSKVQISPDVYKHKTDNKGKDKDRSHLLSKLELKDNYIALSKPYISSATRNNCITVSIKEGDEIIFLDFRLDILLEKLNLIELHKPFHSITKAFYLFVGFTMIALATITILFSLYDFGIYLFKNQDIKLELMFKPIIALTLGIAIFDLAKTILEQEVFFKSYAKNSRVETKMITKFLITIIIALSIEALIVVFKIAIADYDKMINALYLIAGVSLILIALSIFIYFTKKKK